MSKAGINVVKIPTCVLKVYIHCDGCEQEVKKLLKKIEGVYSTNIDAEQGKVTVAGNVDPNTLIKKLKKNGKHAEVWPSKGGNPQFNKQLKKTEGNLQTCVLKVYIHCDGCEQEVKKLLKKIEGVYSTNIDAEQGKVTVAGNVDPNTLIKKLKKNGKHAEVWPSEGGNPQFNKQLQALQIDNGEGPIGGKPQKGGKDLKGQQQQQQQLLQKIKGLEDMKLRQLKDLKPTEKIKGLKSVRFNLPEDDGDVTDRGVASKRGGRNPLFLFR